MVTVTLEEAQEKLPQLLEDALPGEDITVTRDSITVARIQPISQALAGGPGNARRYNPVLGTAEGQVWIAPDFDATPKDFEVG